VDEDLAFAFELADMADAISLGRFRASSLTVARKPDGTLVTDADRSVERALRERIAAGRDHDPVVGEEFGPDGEGGPGVRRWIVDPIDGTNNYLRGIPIFATLIAVERDGELVAGVASAPALGHRWWASKEGGAFGDGRPIRVSAIDRLEEAQLSFDSVQALEEHGLLDRFVALARRCWRTRGFGDFWQHMLVAEGAVDVVVEPSVALWDLAATKVIVEEAGGRLTDLGGVARADGGNAVSTNGLLHDEVLAALGR
jgi:histidinol-phosphatase